MLMLEARRAFDLPILMYHHLECGPITAEFSLPAEVFTRQLDWLERRGYTTLSFDGLFAILDGSRPRPQRPVIITFDDGYESFAELAVPALLERGMTATVFVVAGEVGGYNRWDEAHGVVRRRLMDAAAIHAALGRGFEIGAHGFRHRDLTACSESEAAEETVVARDRLCQRFGTSVDVFAFPYGLHTPREKAILRQCGYRGAVSIFSSSRTVTGDRYAMRRIHVHAGDGPMRFAAKLTRLYLRYAGWRDGRGATGPAVYERECSVHG
jgi:peptidoglycan/xylan/chitin deacetylase (PgdA/CDA1 family)